MSLPYLNRSSNAFLALDTLAGEVLDFVSRSTVVRGSKYVHSFRTSFGEILTGTGWWHSKAEPVSKCTHCAHVCNGALHRGHSPVALQAVATVSSVPQREHFTTSRNPGMLKVLGCTGGCPRGAYSFFGCGWCSGRGLRGSS